MGIDDAPHATASFTPEELRMLEGTWPLDLITDPTKQPTIITEPGEWLENFLTGNHLMPADVVVLPNGTDLFGLSIDDTFPEDVRRCLDGVMSVPDFLRRMQECEGATDTYKFRLMYQEDESNRRQKEIRRDTTQEKLTEMLEMVDSGKCDSRSPYVTEMRRIQVRRVNGKKTRALCDIGCQEAISSWAKYTAYWDRHDEGIFIGGRLSGKALHVDQVLWSNVGKNYTGYKLFALWPQCEESNLALDEFGGRMFIPPLSSEEVACLATASRIAFLRPRDLFFFSGGVPHTAMCVSEEVCVSAYESMVTLNPVHLGHLLQTGNDEVQHEDYGMPEDEFEEIKEDVCDALEDAVAEEERLRTESVTSSREGAWWRDGYRHAQLLETLQGFLVQGVRVCMEDKYMRDTAVQSVVEFARTKRPKCEVVDAHGNNATDWTSELPSRGGS